MARPRPAPSGEPLPVRARRWKRSKAGAARLSGIPGPRSETRSSAGGSGDRHRAAAGADPNPVVEQVGDDLKGAPVVGGRRRRAALDRTSTPASRARGRRRSSASCATAPGRPARGTSAPLAQPARASRSPTSRSSRPPRGRRSPPPRRARPCRPRSPPRSRGSRSAACAGRGRPRAGPRRSASRARASCSEMPLKATGQLVELLGPLTRHRLRAATRRAAPRRRRRGGEAAGSGAAPAAPPPRRPAAPRLPLAISRAER